jgi:hypothetical protein
MKQIEAGMIEPRKVTSSYRRLDDLSLVQQILRSEIFIVEAMLILLDPAFLGLIFDGERVVEMDTINWNEQVGEFHPHQHIYTVQYKAYDFFLALMLLRLYFVLQAVAVLSPLSKLYAKRICHEKGFSVNFAYSIRASMNKHPGLTYFAVFVVSVFGLASLLRIFERPYYNGECRFW